MDSTSQTPDRVGMLRASATFSPEVIVQIQAMAEAGHYEIRGGGAKRALATFDDLVLLTASCIQIPSRGLPRSVRHEDRLGSPERFEPARARHSDHDRRHEFRITFGECEGSPSAVRRRQWERRRPPEMAA